MLYDESCVYNNSSRKGFDLAATDYPVKPISYERYLDASELAVGRMQASPGKNKIAAKTLFDKDGYGWVQIVFDDVLYLQDQDNYVKIVTRNRQSLSCVTLMNPQAKLPAGNFYKNISLGNCSIKIQEMRITR